MKTLQKSVKRNQAFTLVELLVAMVIAIIIMGILVGITNVAMTTWQRGRSEVRAARQAKAMVEAIAKDLEALVVRPGNNFEWLFARTEQTLPGSARDRSVNACELIFFSAPTDRYRGGAGTSTDQGGDVCTASYKLAYQDVVEGEDTKDSTYVFYRQLVDPRPTFNNVLAKTDLRTAFTSVGGSSRFENRTTAAQDTSRYNYVCENIHQYSITFRVDVTRVQNNIATIVPVRVTMGQNGTTTLFRVFGDRIETDAPASNLGVTADELSAGRLSSVEVSLTALSDKGMRELKSRIFKNDQEKMTFLAQNSFEYSKVIEVPGM
jgi:type II secretory pathway pseudopilin PulG